jgi:SAM-dependent methyltransferase
LPRAGAICSGGVTIRHYIIRKIGGPQTDGRGRRTFCNESRENADIEMALIPFLRKSTIEPLAVSMSGVRMGERVLQIGVDDPALLGAIAAKVGLSGQASAVVLDDRAAAKVRSGGERAGALIDVKVSTLDALPFEDATFDVVVIHGRRGLLTSLDDTRRIAGLREIHRVLRQGGRVVLIETGAGGGMFRGRGGERTDPSALSAAGFRPTRLLAEREGYTFTEGLKS